MHLWWDGGAKTTYLSTKMDWQAAAQSEWQVISALASLSEIFMHLLLYVDMLSLPISHLVPLRCSPSRHSFFSSGSPALWLISTCDLSDQVLCLLWLPQNSALYKMERREKKQQLDKAVILHQHWRCRPCVPVSFGWILIFIYTSQAKVIIAVKVSSMWLLLKRKWIRAAVAGVYMLLLFSWWCYN